MSLETDINWPSGVRIKSIECVWGSYSAGVGCHKIEMTHKSGEYASIPYVRVLDAQGRAIAEFSQHSLSGVLYEPDPEAAP